MEGNEDGGGAICASVEALPQRMGDVMPAHLLQCFKYETLTRVQQRVLRVAFKDQHNMMVCAPTGSGKTTVMEAAFLQSRERSRGLWGAKAVYIAPVKALLQERLKDWRLRFGERTIGMTFVELSGDATDVNDNDVAKADVILTTPEKWDAAMRTMHRTGLKSSPVLQTELLLVDEIHHIGDVSRGATLEAVICRMMNLAKREKDTCSGMPIQHLRIVGVSATFSNAEELSTWIQCPPECLFQFGSEFRPVPLSCRVIGCGDATNDFTFERNLDGRIAELIRQYSSGKSSLVFCNSRMATTRLAAFLTQELKRIGMFDATKRDRAAYLDHLDERPSSKVDIALQAGVGYHHAGLSTSDREIVETLFRENKLLILCCTSSLAVGVNLVPSAVLHALTTRMILILVRKPAHLVIIKGTRIYQGSDGYTQYPESQLLQMIGRAGRPGFDSSGTAIILAESSRVPALQRLTSGEAPIRIQSQLDANVLAFLNAEVAQGLITSSTEARRWLQSTFYANQLRLNGMNDIPVKLLEIDSVIQQLIDTNLVSMDKAGQISSTIAGTTMCQGYVKISTMQAIAAFADTQATIAELLKVVSSCDEVRLPLRRQEKAILSQLSESSMRHRMPNERGSSTVASDEDKTSTLIQAVLSNAIVPDDRLLEESVHAVNESERILGVAVEYLSSTKKAESLLVAISLRRCLLLRAWDDATGRESLKHACADAIIVASLEYIGIRSIRQLAEADPDQIDSFLRRNPPVGRQLVKKAGSLKDFRVNATWKPRGRRSQKVLKITVASSNRDQEGFATLLVWANSKLLHLRTKICDTYEHEVELPKDLACPIHIRLLNDEIPGLDSRLEVDLPTNKSTKKSERREQDRQSEVPRDQPVATPLNGKSTILNSILELAKRHANAKQQQISQFMVKKKPSEQPAPQKIVLKNFASSRTPITVGEAELAKISPHRRKRPRIDAVRDTAQQQPLRSKARDRTEKKKELEVIPIDTTLAQTPNPRRKTKISTNIFDKFRFKGTGETESKLSAAIVAVAPCKQISPVKQSVGEEMVRQPRTPGPDCFHMKLDNARDHPFLKTYLRQKDALQGPSHSSLLQGARSSIEYSLFERVRHQHAHPPEEHLCEGEDSDDDPFAGHVVPSEDPFSSIFF